jgi:hypothetical protein
LLDTGTGPGELQWARGSHDGYQNAGMIHTRRVELSEHGARVTVSDEVSGGDAHQVAMHLHFAPDVELSPGEKPGTWLAVRHGAKRQLHLEVDASWLWEALRGSESPRMGWYSPALGVLQPAFALRGVRRAPLPLRVVTRIAVR